MNKIFVILFLFIFDYFSKQWVFNSVDLNSFYNITFFFDIAHIHNFGIAFGLLSGLLPAWFFVLIGMLVTMLISLFYFHAKTLTEKWGIIIIIAGAISNIFDRLINGYVLDFIYLHYQKFYWPAFNFADIYISLGVFLILLQILKDFNKKIFK